MPTSVARRVHTASMHAWAVTVNVGGGPGGSAARTAGMTGWAEQALDERQPALVFAQEVPSDAWLAVFADRGSSVTLGCEPVYKIRSGRDHRTWTQGAGPDDEGSAEPQLPRELGRGRTLAQRPSRNLGPGVLRPSCQLQPDRLADAVLGHGTPHTRRVTTGPSPGQPSSARPIAVRPRSAS